jgi:hypothetical protein
MNKRIFAGLAACALMVGMAEAFKCGTGPNGVIGPRFCNHPGYDLVTIRPSDFSPKVSALEFLPSGELLVLTWRGDTYDGSGTTGTYSASIQNYGLFPNGFAGATPRALFKLSAQVKGKDRSQVTWKKVGDQALFRDPQGMLRVGSDIYVGDIHQIVKLVDADGDGVYEAVQKIGDLPTGRGWFEYSFGPVLKDGYLYMGLASAVQNSGVPTKQTVGDKSSVVRIPIGGGKYEVVAEGLRAPDGIAIGPEGEIFTWDNQGSWKPASRMDHIQQGKWYGYVLDPEGPIQKTERAAGREEPPAIYAEHDFSGSSLTEPVFLQHGPFKGQFIQGDVAMGQITRAFLEKVNGAWQGGMVPFFGGLEAGPHRMREDDQGHIYIGMLGNNHGNDGNQGWAGQLTGLQKLIPNGASAFEIYSVSSRAGGLEIQFTMPVAAGANQASLYKVENWRNIPSAPYGGGHKMELANLTVGTPRICAEDAHRVFLPLAGLQKGRVIHIEAGDVRSADNKTFPTNFNHVWYTLNNISTSEPCSAPSKTVAPARSLPGFWTERIGAHELRVNLPSGKAYAVDLVAVDGTVLFSRAAASGALTITHPRLGEGMELLRVRGEGESMVRPLAL